MRISRVSTSDSCCSGSEFSAARITKTFTVLRSTFFGVTSRSPTRIVSPSFTARLAGKRRGQLLAFESQFGGGLGLLLDAGVVAVHVGDVLPHARRLRLDAEIQETGRERDDDGVQNQRHEHQRDEPVDPPRFVARPAHRGPRKRIRLSAAGAGDSPTGRGSASRAGSRFPCRGGREGDVAGRRLRRERNRRAERRAPRRERAGIRVRRSSRGAGRKPGREARAAPAREEFACRGSAWPNSDPFLSERWLKMSSFGSTDRVRKGSGGPGRGGAGAADGSPPGRPRLAGSADSGLAGRGTRRSRPSAYRNCRTGNSPSACLAAFPRGMPSAGRVAFRPLRRTRYHLPLCCIRHPISDHQFTALIGRDFFFSRRLAVRHDRENRQFDPAVAAPRRWFPRPGRSRASSR